MKKAGIFLAVLVLSIFAHATDSKPEPLKTRIIASEGEEDYLKKAVAFYKDALRKTSVVYICETPEMLTSIAYNIYGKASYKAIPVGTQHDPSKKAVTACFIWSNEI